MGQCDGCRPSGEGVRGGWVVRLAVAGACALVAFGGAPPAGAQETPKGGGSTAAQTTAEAWFGDLRARAAAKDEAALKSALPSSLVEAWDDLKADDAKVWRSELAARIAAGTVVKVVEDGGDATARWKTTSPTAEWQIRMRREGAGWVVSEPWAWCVAGGDLAKANGSKPGRVRLKTRRVQGPYGPSAFSFTHVTQDPEQCKNRMDLWFCHCGNLHPRNESMISERRETSLADVDGIPVGGDWMDQMVPKARKVYVMRCLRPGRMDFYVGFTVTSVGDDGVEIEWRLVAIGRNAPASVRSPQPLVSRDGADGADGICAGSGR